MFPEMLELPIVFAVTPVVGALALQRIWFRQRPSEDLRAQEERAAATRREAMRALHDALLATERAQRAREEFLSRMSHELRTPLNAVIGFSRLMEENRAGNQRPQDIHMLGRVREGGEHLLKLVEDVLEQARLARGALAIEVSDVDVAAVAGRVVGSYAQKATMKGLRFAASLPSPMIASLDAGRFEQVLHHLVDNAVKFTSTGTVRVEAVANPATGGPMEVVVSDTGIGIPKDRLEAIFEPFEQVEESPGRHYGGAGLGLPLARQLCVAMGCTLTAESEPGRGSRFTIRFPTGS